MPRHGCWGLGLLAVWALCAHASPSVPPEVVQVSRQRDVRCSHLTFVWRMDFHLVREGVVQYVSATLRVARWEELTLVQLIPDDTHIPPKALSAWHNYYGGGWGLRSKPVFLSGDGRAYPKWLAFAYRCPGNCLYYEAPVPREMYEPHPLEFSILAGADFVKIMDASWTVKRQDAQFWLLEGTYHLPPFNVPAYLRIRLHKNGGTPEAIEQYSEKWQYQVSWQVKRFKRVFGLLFPEEVIATWRTRPDVRHELPNKRAVFRLVRVERTPKPIRIDIPAGTPVQDFGIIDYWDLLNVVGIRMADGDFVNYRWQGELPDKSALRALALQQGKLPGQKPRVRATWILFLPGLLLIVLGWYLYRRIRQSM